MDDLIKQILLLPIADRKKLAEIIHSSLNEFGEGYYYSFEDFSINQTDIIKQRLSDIQLEKECLIEFDDHLLTIK
jgi:hypothetical protein